MTWAEVRRTRDALIVAGALTAGGHTLRSEDLPHAQRIARRLTIRNPFL